MSIEDDTAVQSQGEGRYAAAVSNRWDALGRTPNGGYLLALAVRALALELPHPDPVAVSAVFARPGSHGSAELAVRLLRAGRRLSTETIAQEGDTTMGDIGVERREVEFEPVPGLEPEPARAQPFDPVVEPAARPSPAQPALPVPA